jgi:hypothetical protein
MPTRDHLERLRPAQAKSLSVHHHQIFQLQSKQIQIGIAKSDSIANGPTQ